MSEDKVKEKEQPASQTLAAVRNRSVFLLNSVLWTLAAGAVILAVRTLLEFQSAITDSASRTRAALGISRPASGIDFYFLISMLLLPGLLVLLSAAIYLWYRRVLNRKLRAVWSGQDRSGRITHVAPLTTRCASFCGCRRCREKLLYLRALLSSPAWEGRWADIASAAGAQDRYASSIGPDQYEPIAEALFAQLERDIAARALTAGLIVGVSQNRFLDLCTIVVSNFEMQSYVLAQLGKRPRCDFGGAFAALAG